jgi:ADP-ribose pyrophosphatase YjhB (NUDIX family)
MGLQQKKTIHTFYKRTNILLLFALKQFGTKIVSLCNRNKTTMQFDRLLKYCPHCGSEKFVQNNEKSKKCDACGFVFYMNASAAVAAFITDTKGRLLVCKRAKEPAKGTLDLPGGFVDGDETAEEAVVRELKEELDAETITVNYVFSLPNNYLYSGLTIPTLDLFFECKLQNYENLKAADDVAGFEYISIENLNPELFGLNSIKKAIDIYIRTKTQQHNA